MNQSIAFFILLLSMACTTDKYPSSQITKVVANEASRMMDEPFGITLQMDKVDQEKYHLVVSIELERGSYVISPYSQDTVYGHFNFRIKDTDHLMIDKTLLEIPNSVEEIDPILEEPVKFVRVNTTYTQTLEVLKQDDFEVSGLIEFVLEPSCVLYDVEFVLSYRAGIMKVKKTKTTISKEYKL